MNSRTHKKAQLKKECKRFLISLLVCAIAFGVFSAINAFAATSPGFSMEFTPTDGADDVMGALDVLVMFGFMAVLPSIVLMMTSFTRIIIVLSFMRNALGTQQSPPNMVLTGLALFLTLFIMQPVLEEVKTTAYEPYKAGAITQQQALDVGSLPLKRFMLKQTDIKALNLFINISKIELGSVEPGQSLDALMKLPLTIVVPSFITSELERAFLIGFFLYIPFLIIDIVVSSVLMSMGMVMLPPAMISLPFKILMFVLVNGWSLLMSSIVQGFSG